MKKILLLSALTCQAVLGFAQSQVKSYLKDPGSYREHNLDIKHLKLEVKFDTRIGKVFGKVSHEFTALQERIDSVFFDAPNIDIKKSTLNGQDLPFKVNKTGVWVYPQKPLAWEQSGIIYFEYECLPKRGIYFIGWNEKPAPVSDPFAVRKQIWTQGQGIDNRHWIPMYDDMNDKFTTETIIHFDSEYEVLSNGAFIKKQKNKDQTTTWHYKMSKPHAGYLLMIAIGKYGIAKAKSKRGVPLNYYYYPEFADRMEPTYRHTPAMIDFMEEYTGINYPWETYSQVMVQDFLYGAMENTTATIFGDFFNVDAKAFNDRNYVSVNMHELTHQWFGDYITARDGRDTWLQESYATFFPKQFSKVIDGENEWSWQRRAHQNAAVEAGKKDDYPVRHTKGGTARVYPKGAAVISMLEYVLGEAQWKKVLHHYLKKHAYSNVETNDLQQAIKDVLGLNLDWFFDEWIYRGGEPHYRVHYEDLSYQDGSRSTEIAIEQIHATNETIQYFRMPVVLEVYYEDGSKDEVKEVLEEAFEVIKINNPKKKKIAFVLFDPNSNIIKQVTFKKKFEELEEQIEKAPYYLDRYDAAVALRELPIEQKREVIHEAIKREKHYGIINELIQQIANDENAQSQNILQSLLKHEKSVVREQVLNKNKTWTEAWKLLYEKSLNDNSYDVQKTALEKLCKAYPSEAAKYLEICKDSYGMNQALKLKWIELSIENQYKKEEALSLLELYVSPSFEFRTRVAAFQLLKSLNHVNESVLSSLFQACLSSNGRLSGPAVDLLNNWMNQSSIKKMAEDVFKKSNFTTEQKEQLQKQVNLFK
ncbi:MAG: M1 family metallopeptidase [Bacteroidia bacterium]